MLPTIALFAVTLLADSKAEILKKLDDAKSDYKQSEALHRKTIDKAFDAMEDAARKDGSKKAVAAAKQSREVFKVWGEFPSNVPRATMADARGRLVKVYDDAIRELIMAKADDEVEKLEKEFRTFRIESALLSGKFTYLSKLKPFNLKSASNGFTTNGTQGETKVPLQFKGLPLPHTLFFQTRTGDNVQASYNLLGKYHGFRAIVGIPRIEEKAENPASAPIFEVIGDGKSLWKSKPADKIEDFQTIEVNVEKVKVLTLAVHCWGSSAWGRTAWFEPILIDP